MKLFNLQITQPFSGGGFLYNPLACVVLERQRKVTPNSRAHISIGHVCAEHIAIQVVRNRFELAN